MAFGLVAAICYHLLATDIDLQSPMLGRYYLSLPPANLQNPPFGRRYLLPLPANLWSLWISGSPADTL